MKWAPEKSAAPSGMATHGESRKLAAAAGGAVILRVHDVADSVRYLRMMGAIARTTGSVVTAGSAAR